MFADNFFSSLRDIIRTCVMVSIFLRTIKARCYPRSLQSRCRLFRHLRMVENVGYALGAIACSLANQAIYIALTDGVVKLA